MLSPNLVFPSRQLVPNTHVVRYEDVLGSPEYVVQSILTAYGIRAARSTFLVTKTDIKASGSEGCTTQLFRRSAYYQQSHFLRHFTRDSYDAYVPFLDSSVEAQAGYIVPTWDEVRSERGLSDQEGHMQGIG